MHASKDLVILIFVISLSLLHTTNILSQDTTDLILNHDGSKSFQLISKGDTILISTYPNGNRESRRLLKKREVNGTYTRYYPNGKPMWKKSMQNGKQQGSAVFYDQFGVKVAELRYEKGQIQDTLYIRSGIHLMLGRVSYSSRVVGGMVREDGSSNISEHSGMCANCAMYAVKTDSLKKPKLITRFKSDAYGDFFILVPEGKLGFYPVNIKLESLGPGNYRPPESMWSSGTDAWSVKGPLEVRKTDKLLFVKLHRASVGYAP